MKHLLSCLIAACCITNCAYADSPFYQFSCHINNVFSVALNGSLNKDKKQIELCAAALKPLANLYMTADFSTNSDKIFAYIKDSQFGLSARLGLIGLMRKSTDPYTFMVNKSFPGNYNGYKPSQILFIVAKNASPQIDVVFTSKDNQCVLSSSKSYDTTFS